MTAESISHSLKFSVAFWSDVAERVLAHDALQNWTLLVPELGHAEHLRAALAHAAKARGQAVLRLPKITTPALWLQQRLADLPNLSGAGQTRQCIELFDSLRQTDWLAQALANASGGGLWALTRQLLALGNELSWASLAQADQAGAMTETRLRKLFQKSYHARAWSACSPEAELVLSVWRASFAELSQVNQSQMITETHIAEPDALCLIAPEMWGAHEAMLVQHYAAEGPRIYIDIDSAASLPYVLKQAWPECLYPFSLDEPMAQINLRERAEQLREFEPEPAASTIELIAATSLEDEATSIVMRMLQWLDEGKRSIGLIALDRVVARRVRALLERAGVLVRDDNGWKLSTSSAAGTLMRWLELAEPAASARPQANCDSQALLDWLKSPFVWQDLEDKAALLACIETALRRDKVARGWPAILGAVHASMQNDPEHAALAQRAYEQLVRVRTQSAMPRGRQSLQSFFNWLLGSLSATQMRAAFVADAVGARLIELLDELFTQLAMQTQGSHAASQRYRFTEWRDFIADALENTSFRERGIDSPIVFCSLFTARLRCFDALAIVGADARHFPMQGSDSLFLTPGLRAELGLSQRDSEQHRQLLDLALLMASCPSVVVTWQALQKGEPNALAAPLQRLSLLHRQAYGDDLHRKFIWPRVQVRAHAKAQPAPTAAALLPAQLSATGYNRFISCPYRYYVDAMLGLRPLDEIEEEAEKRHYGELLHRILQAFHRHLDEETQALERDVLMAQLRDVSAQNFAPLVEINGSYIAWRERWFGVIESYIDWFIDWSATGWRFEAAEQWQSVALPLQSGGSLNLQGRIDRIDVYGDHSDAMAEYAIIDYKAQSKKSLSDKLARPGEDVQLPFYRMLLPEQHVAMAFYLSVDDRKVERVDAAIDADVDAQVDAVEIDALSEALWHRIDHDFSRIATHAPLPANGADSACEYCDDRGLCRKGHWSAT